ncbi:MAG: histidine kinase [Clostridia bacterium]|nr:histidine kinase [Clostridia bacterium]
MKNKLDPHFVFNSLSVLTELIHQEPKLAEEYCVRFSRLYRHLLVSFDKDYISINESLMFVQEYVKLQQYRMEGKIELDIRCFANTLEEYLFPLSLQTLVENSIKHNIPSVGEVLRITITRDENYMIVTNNIIGEPSTPLSFGIGLQTLYLQYKMNNLPEPSIEHNMEMFEVRIMILKKINNE